MKRVERFEVRIVGVGGQGVRTAGAALALAAVLDGLNASHWPSYGVEVRGGPSVSDVVISSGEIDYPRVLLADVLVALDASTLGMYAGSLKRGGTLLADSARVPRPQAPEGARIVSLPLSRTAEELGRPQAVNAVALGALVALAGIPTAGSVARAIAELMGAGVNLEAFRRGMELAGVRGAWRW